MSILTTEGGTTNGGNTSGNAGDGGAGSGSNAGGSTTSSSQGGAGGNAGSGSTSGGSSTGSSTTASWRDSLPDDLKSDESLAQFTDIAALAKSYVHTKKTVGKKGVILPGEKASDEEWNTFYDSLGRPSVDKYEVKEPEGKKVKPEFIDEFKQMAHKAGVLPKQAQALMDFYIGFEEKVVGEAQRQQKIAMEQGLSDLKKEWGDGFDKQIALAKLGVKESGMPEVTDFLEKTGLGDHPVMIKLMAKMGSLFGEDKIRGEGGGKFGQTPAELQNEIDKVLSDPKHPYFDRSHAGHTYAVKQMESLFKKLHGAA